MAVFLRVGALGPPINALGPKDDSRSLAVSLGLGWVWVEALCIPLKPLGCFICFLIYFVYL